MPKDSLRVTLFIMFDLLFVLYIYFSADRLNFISISRTLVAYNTIGVQQRVERWRSEEKETKAQLDAKINCNNFCDKC